MVCRMSTMYYSECNAECKAVLLVSRALGVKIYAEKVDLDNKESLPEEFKTMNPEQKTPVLCDVGSIFTENTEILRYLALKSNSTEKDTLYPADEAKRAVVDELLQLNLENIKSFLREVAAKLETSTTELPGAALSEQLAKDLDNLQNKADSVGPYLTGSVLTIADLSIAVQIAAAQEYGLDLNAWPRLVQWMGDIKLLPYYREANGGAMETLRALQRGPSSETTPAQDVTVSESIGTTVAEVHQTESSSVQSEAVPVDSTTAETVPADSTTVEPKSEPNKKVDSAVGESTETEATTETEALNENKPAEINSKPEQQATEPGTEEPPQATSKPISLEQAVSELSIETPQADSKTGDLAAESTAA